MKENLSTIDALLFDLDGTLWSPLSLSLHCWRTACRLYGVSSRQVTEENLRLCFGQSPCFIMSLLIGECPSVLQKQVCETAFALENQNITKHMGLLYPRVEETIQILARFYPLFIVSNCQAGYIEAFLEAYKLSSFFVDFCSSEATSLSKDQNITYLVKTYTLGNPLYIGDTESDARAAMISHVPFLYAAYGFGTVTGSRLVLNAFSDLPELLHVR